jgi:hypothetical protein
MASKNFRKNWVFRGLIWGSIMFLALAIVFPLAEGEEILIGPVAIKLIIWLVLGLGYGFFVHNMEIEIRKDLES